MFLIRSHIGTRPVDATFTRSEQATSNAKGGPNHPMMLYASRQASAFADRRKLKRKVTPRQNSLFELYGHVSAINEQFFSDESVGNLQSSGAFT